MSCISWKEIPKLATLRMISDSKELSISKLIPLVNFDWHYFFIHRFIRYLMFNFSYGTGCGYSANKLYVSTFPRACTQDLSLIIKVKVKILSWRLTRKRFLFMRLIKLIFVFVHLPSQGYENNLIIEISLNILYNFHVIRQFFFYF